MQREHSGETWYKMDNVAKVFLATYARRDTRSFRLSCYLTETVDPEVLDQAAKRAAQDWPQNQVTIHKGLFWHYMQTTDKLPEVEEEHERPCPSLYGMGKEGQLHYKVTYFDKRINLDMFHAISDGNGGLEFLNMIVLNYLKILHPEEMANVSVGSGASSGDLEEDSFEHFRGKKIAWDQPKKKAYHLKGRKLPYDQLQFLEVHMPASEMLSRAKAAGVSLTSYMGAKLMLAIYADMPLLKRKKPITISLPVNLRNYFPSATSRNFFNSIYATKVLKGDETVESLAAEFDKQLKDQLTPEKIAARMNRYELFETLPLVRVVPLFIKNPVVAAGSRQEGRTTTAVLSNMGKVVIPEEMKKYVAGYAPYCSTASMFVTVCSYENDLVYGIAYAYRSTRVLKNFIRSITKDDIPVSVYAMDVVK